MSFKNIIVQYYFWDKFIGFLLWLKIEFLIGHHCKIYVRILWFPPKGLNLRKFWSYCHFGHFSRCRFINLANSSQNFTNWWLIELPYWFKADFLLKTCSTSGIVRVFDNFFACMWKWSEIDMLNSKTWRGSEKVFECGMGKNYLEDIVAKNLGSLGGKKCFWR